MGEQSPNDQELSPEEQLRQKILDKFSRPSESKVEVSQELIRRREVGELAPYDYDVNYISYLQGMDLPVTRKDIENHAILIRPNEFENLGYLEFINADGEKIILDFTDENFDTDHPFILFPEELGDEKSQE